MVDRQNILKKIKAKEALTMSPFDGRQTQNNRIRGVGVRVEGVAAAAVLALELGIRERLKFVITGLAALGARDTNPPLHTHKGTQCT
jgi:hypothetical protein